jgi:hypothetical protein
MKNKIFIFLLLVATQVVQAQSTEPVSSVAADRPGMATGVGVLPLKAIQW